VQFSTTFSGSSIRNQTVSTTERKKGVILDGHHRYKVCQELQIIHKIETKDFEDGLYEELFVIDINLQRRHLTPVKRVELYLRRKPLLTEIAKRVRQSNLKQNQSPKDKILPLGKVNTQIANDSGVSREQVRKIEAILEKGPEELKDRVRAGKTSVNYAFKMVTRAEDHKNTPKLPQGQFDIILADPPWIYDINTRGSPDEHYNTMTNVEI
jgi:ParB-like chromosome segregation protein Spo0J